MQMEIQTTVLGGLPVLVEFEVSRPERDCGWSGGVGDIVLYTVRGKPAPWAERRMTDRDWRALEGECMEAVS